MAGANHVTEGRSEPSSELPEEAGDALEAAVGGDHGLVRFGWQLTGPDGPVVTGLDVAVVAPDGRLERVAGFFGDLG